MARKTIPLTDTQIKTVKAIDKEMTLFDGGGLELLVKPTGVKIWRFRWLSPTTGKRSVITIGNYPAITLKMARDEAKLMTSLVSQGIDPRDARKQEKENVLLKFSNTFEKVALDYFQVKKTKGISENTLKDFWRTMEKYTFPIIGKMPIGDITAPIIIEMMKPLTATGKFEMVKRVTQRVNEILFHAVHSGLIHANPTANISKVFEKPKVKHRPSIPPEELPELMKALQVASINMQTRLVIEWQLLTITRPSESAGAKWSEIDLDKGLWTIPAGRMKMKREHVIPLSKQALDVLDTMKPISGHLPYVFPSNHNRNEPMNNQTANMALKRMGYKDKLVAHGMRAIASTALNAQGFSPDVIEAALAHIDTNEVRRAYNRNNYLEQRKPLMAWWGDFVEEASKGSTMVATGTKALRAIND